MRSSRARRGNAGQGQLQVEFSLKTLQASTTHTAEPPTQLRRELGLGSAAAAVAGEGPSPLAFSSLPAGMAELLLGSPFWLLFAWLLIGAISHGSTLCFGELRSALCEADMYVYLRQAFGEPSRAVWMDRRAGNGCRRLGRAGRGHGYLLVLHLRWSTTVQSRGGPVHLGDLCARRGGHHLALDFCATYVAQVRHPCAAGDLAPGVHLGSS